MITISKCAMAPPQESLEIGDHHYRVGKLDDNQLIVCHRLCVGQNAAGPEADCTITTAILAHALITHHQPSVTIRELVEQVTPDLIALVTVEVARQMMAAKDFIAAGVH